MFTYNMKLAEVVQSDFNTLNVINRFGVKLGFGEKSVAKVCAEYGINTDFFLEILNAFHDPNYFPQKHLQRFSVAEIVEYLRKTHRSYIDEDIPFIEELMNRMLEDCENPSQIKPIVKFFNDYKTELFSHLHWEDRDIFPYNLAVEKAYANGNGAPAVLEAMQKYSMTNFLEEHDDIESKLYDINTLFIKYVPPVSNQMVCVRILKEFSLLQKDINNHARIEEKVLAPKVIEMEKALLQRK
ncbi:MAG: hemerythrin domain-containing protein [Bacteroidales bacterium]|nr:hemerythrin domain-containing protein [Bacteroidales bacterium]MDY0255247.1 hemerythrin domain-containing protein [Tenuifilaceae bacterium]